MNVTIEQQFKLMYEILFSLASNSGGKVRISILPAIRLDGMFLEADPSDNSVTVHITPETVN